MACFNTLKAALKSSNTGLSCHGCSSPDHVPACGISCCPRPASASSTGFTNYTSYLGCIAYADTHPRLTASCKAAIILYDLAVAACLRNIPGITQNQAPSQCWVLSSQSSWYAAVADAWICGKQTCWHVHWKRELGSRCSGQSSCQKAERAGIACLSITFLSVTALHSHNWPQLGMYKAVVRIIAGTFVVHQALCPACNMLHTCPAEYSH